MRPARSGPRTSTLSLPRCAAVLVPLVSLGLLRCGGGENNATPGGADGGTCVPLTDGRCVQETFSNPPLLLPDEDGVYRLSLAPTEVSIAGQRHCVRAYNGSYTAPTIDTPAREGSTPRSLRLDLANLRSAHPSFTPRAQLRVAAPGSPSTPRRPC